MKIDNLQKQKNTITEKHLLQTELSKPIILVTYDQPVQIKKSVKVRTYDLKVDKDKMISMDCENSVSREKKDTRIQGAMRRETTGLPSGTHRET